MSKNKPKRALKKKKKRKITPDQVGEGHQEPRNSGSLWNSGKDQETEEEVK